MNRTQLSAVIRLFLVAPLIVAFLGGCATSAMRHHATSVVDYLYPNVKEPQVSEGIPLLKLPIRVGIAFVPSGTTYGGDPVLTENKKTELLQAVANHFKKYPFIKSIEIIPTAYLRPRGGFTNLEQIRTMYGVDVVALVSYDQTQFTDRGVLSFSYWTIIGAYVVQGEKNETHIMLDTVVFDIQSRKMLFRAPGLSRVRSSATPINLSEELRKNRALGLDQAAQDMIANLDTQLTQFKDKVKERPAEYRVVHTPGYVSGGGGSVDTWMLALLAALGTGFAWTRRRG